MPLFLNEFFSLSLINFDFNETIYRGDGGRFCARYIECICKFLYRHVTEIRQFYFGKLIENALLISENV